MSRNEVIIKTTGMTFEDVLAVARHDAKVVIAPATIEAVALTRSRVDALASSPDPVYGISTGFGALANRHVTPEYRVQLQKSLIRSHAAGLGNLVEREVTRALMTLRLKTLCSGHTGVRPVVVETMAAILNAGITPAVYEFGSLGCSGDLAPLAHCALVLMGEGEVVSGDGQVTPAADALKTAGIDPVELREKEGLALINGTDGMLGMLIMAIDDLTMLCDSVDVTAAMSVEALLGTDKVFLPELHEPLRPHPGQALSAANMLSTLKGSAIVASHIDDTSVVQDAYSLHSMLGQDAVAVVRGVQARKLCRYQVVPQHSWQRLHQLNHTALLSHR